MKSEESKNLKNIVLRFKEKNILVLGDLMLDKYIWGNVKRISPEAPVPIVSVNKDSLCLGGSGNVGNNLQSMGASSLIVGVVGNDPEGDWIKINISNPRGVFTDMNRPTTVKTRIIAHQQQVVRVDNESKEPLSSEVEENILDFIRKEKSEGIIMSDYNKGVLTETLVERILAYASEKNISVFVDPKYDNFHLYTPVTLLSPNHIEVEKIVHHECISDSSVERAGETILARNSVGFLLIKRGEQGMTVFEKGAKPLHFPTIAREVFDVTGAGDTVIAVASLALLSGATVKQAAVLANIAAGVVVGKLGTATVTSEELIHKIESQDVQD